MYETIDDEVFLAPESIIAGILAASAIDDGPEWPTVAPADDAGLGDADGDAVIGAWSRHARAANGFGG